jgi:phage pi2 protein 07
MSMKCDLRLRVAATNGSIVYLPGDTGVWRAKVMMMLTGENS